MAERQRRTAASIIEEIQHRVAKMKKELAILDLRRQSLIVQMNTLEVLLEGVDGANDDPPAPTVT